MLKKYTTVNYKQTQKLGEKFGKEILLSRTSQKTATFAKASAAKAVVIGLSGNLGGGKTTFLQGFAKGLKIKEKILSPTFVILKRFEIKNKNFDNFYHIDCYRLGNEKPARNASHSDAGGDILELNFREIISNPKNIVVIEWPEKIKKVLPKNTIFLDFKFIDEDKREIKFKI